MCQRGFQNQPGSIGHLAGNAYLCTMRKHKETGLDFVVNKLTNSIENVVTGDSFATEVAVLLQEDLKTVTKAKGWLLIGKQNSKTPSKKPINLQSSTTHPSYRAW